MQDASPPLPPKLNSLQETVEAGAWMYPNQESIWYGSSSTQEEDKPATGLERVHKLRA